MYKSILTWIAIITLVFTGMVQSAWALSFTGYLKMWACTGEHSFSLGEDSGLRFTVVWDSTLHPYSFGIKNSDKSLDYTSRKFTGKQSGDTFYPDFALGPGSYKLYITSCVSWGGHGTYTISYQVITPRFQNDTEPNDDIEDSQWVSIPGVIEGHLGYYDNKKAGPGGVSPLVSKTDNFIGDINRKGNLYVTFDSDDTLCMYSFLIYDEDGEYVGGHILEKLLCNVPGVEYGPYPISKKGGYLIVCTSNWQSGGYGSYRLKTRMEYDHSGESAPIVVSTDPMPNEQNVSLRKKITIVFSELMDHGTLTDTNIFIKLLIAPNVWSPITYSIAKYDIIDDVDPGKSHTEVTLSREWPLATNTKYFITVEGVEDTDGDPIDAPYSEPFKTTSKQDPAMAAARVSAMFLLLGIGP